MSMYFISAIIGLVVGLLVMHLLDVRYLQSINDSFDKAQDTYIRGMQSLRQENSRLLDMINNYQISHNEKRGK